MPTSKLVTGGVLKAKLNQEFLTHTVPEITPNTVVLGVCGIPPEDASPLEDGWFFSDFFAFNYLLKGLGRQTWLSSVGPRDLLTEHGEYLHGNPFCDRKVVLDETIIEELSPVLVLRTSNLRQGFLHILSSECEFARLSNRPVLVFLFGHGHYQTKGVFLGTSDAKVTIPDFVQAIGENVAVTVISTACFSGGWAVHPLLNITASTAAGPEKFSESWPPSGSVGRTCGSIYATALIQSLSECSTTKDKCAEIETYNEFARTVRETLVTRVDRLGAEHDISFCAQDDNWEAPWSQRTGIPLEDFKGRWAKLPARPSTMEPSLCNRDPLATTPSTPTLSWRLGRLGGRFGGTERSQKRFVQQLARDHLSTCPGTWTVGHGPKVGGMLRQFIAGTKYTSAEILTILEYRHYMIDLVNRLCADWKIPLPDGKKCFEFFEKEWSARIRSDTPDVLEKFVKVTKLIDKVALFPSATKEQGFTFYQARNYLAAALVVFSMEECERVVSEMKQGMYLSYMQHVISF